MATFYFSNKPYCYVENIDDKEQVYDALKRTAYAMYAYQDEPLLIGQLKASIALCFNEDGTIKRYPDAFGEDTSRDMVIAAIAMLNKVAPETAKEYAGYVKFQISKKYRCVPSLWFWLKFIQHDKKVYKVLFRAFYFIEQWLLLSIPFTLLIRFLLGIKDNSEAVQQSGKFDPIEHKPFKKFLISLTYRGFATFLSAQMFWAICEKSRAMQWYARLRDKNNYVVQAMFGKVLTKHPPPPPMNDIRFEVHFDDTNDRYFRQVENTGNLSIDFHNKFFNTQNNG